MMFIPLKWTLKMHIYGPIMDHMNSGSSVSTSYRNRSIYFPYGVPIVPIMSLKVDIFSKISTLRCRYNVHAVHTWFIFEFFFSSFSFLLLLILLHIEFSLGRCTKLTYFLHFYSCIFTFPICLFLPVFLYPIFTYNNYKYYRRNIFNFKMFLPLF